MTTKITHPLVFVALVLAIVASLALGQRPVAAQGIGIYPTNLSFENAARSGEYFRTVGVINSGDSDTIFTLEGEGPIGGWISFVEVNDRSNVIESVTVPGNSERQILLQVTVPEDAANGEYLGFAQVVARGGTAQGGGSSVGVGAAIDVSVNVTGDQRFDGSLVDSSVSDVELGYPLRVRATVRNSGNVRITPQVTLEVVDPDNNVVMQETFPTETVVFPSETGQLTYEVDVSARDLGEGEYLARVSATAGDLELGRRQTSFSILPVGTLTRLGQLRDLRMAIAPGPGELGKLDVVFVNTGQIDTLAKFVGQLYQSGRLIDALSSEELLVAVREQRTLELLFRVNEPGDYLIKGKVNYQGKETESKELTFTVSEEGPAEQPISRVGGAEASEPSDSGASGAGGIPASGQSEEPVSVWQNISNSLQESPFNSPLGISVVALGVLVVLLLVLLIGRRRASHYW